jgi:hypothetical protein
MDEQAPQTPPAFDEAERKHRINHTVTAAHWHDSTTTYWWPHFDGRRHAHWTIEFPSAFDTRTV